MTLTLGVAIPCYSGHHHYIDSLLENIASSTVKPTQIVISCSSWNHNSKLYADYKGISVIIWYSTQRLNQATNRNRAASLLNTDLISFIDADDMMHPRRIEFLISMFEQRPDISVIYHDFLSQHVSTRNDPFWEEEAPNPLSNKIVKNPNAFGIMLVPTEYPLHHAHLTVRKNVFDVFKFDEDWNVYRTEDSRYAALLANHDVPALYLHNKLSRYIFN
jgi:hypothetical protein